MQDSPLGRFVVESALIVGSILFAFAIDAAWDARGDRMDEQRLLRDLRADFTESKRLMERADSSHRAHLAATTRYFEWSSDRGASAVPDDVLLALLQWHSSDPVMGALRSATTSGRISVLDNEALRTRLATWEDLFEDLSEDEAWDRETTLSLTESVAQYLPLRSMSYRLGHPAVPAPSDLTPDYEGLAGSLDVENWVMGRAAGITFLLVELAAVSATIDTIIGLIDAELD